MQIILNAPGIHQKTKEGVEKELETFLPRLKQILFRFRPEEKNLRVHLAQRKNNAYCLTLSIHMPGKSLIVERDGHTLLAVMNEAKQALIEQIKVQAAVVRKENLRDKVKQQSQAVQDAVGTPSMLSKESIDEEDHRERFVSRLRLVLPDLYNHVRRLIDFAQLARELPLNHLQAEEVVDDILARAYEIFRSQQDGELSHSTLYQLTEELFRDEINSYAEDQKGGQSAENKASSRESVWEASDLGEEMLGYYRPDEALLYSDIIPDAKLSDSVQSLSDKEQMQGIFQSLSRVSYNARAALLMNRIEGFSLYEIALLQARQEEEVNEDILHCEEAIRQHLPSNS